MDADTMQTDFLNTFEKVVLSEEEWRNVKL